MSQILSPQLLIEAYRMGIFPMAHDDGEIYWFSPDPRCIFPLERFHVPRSLRQVLRRGVFETRVDTAFAEVIEACADRAEGTWISDDIIIAYTALHELGYAHSVESWRSGRLVGGLYGVAIGGAFFGESMYTVESNASKVALVRLVERMRERGYALLDTQWPTPHLQMFGATEISRSEYMRRLKGALRRECRFS